MTEIIFCLWIYSASEIHLASRIEDLPSSIEYECFKEEQKCFNVAEELLSYSRKGLLYECFKREIK